MTKKVVYMINSLAHARVFESFQPHNGLEQTMLLPKLNVTTSLVPEDYSNFGIKNIKIYQNIQDAQNIIDMLRPDVLVQANVFKMNAPSGCKKVYVSHGMVGKHALGKGEIKTWGGFDLYCGATDVFRQWITTATKTKPEQVLLDAMPQLDLLYDPNYYQSYRPKILSKLKPDATKIVLFCGFCCKDSWPFDDHNEDYFKATIALDELARKNNWLILVKPRQQQGEMIGFLQGHKGLHQYIEPYKKVQNSKYTHFVSTNSHLYRYYCADVIICNGTSTAEIEACLMHKPLVLVRTKAKKDYDPFETEKFGAAIVVKDIKDLEQAIIRPAQVQNQDSLVKAWGIIHDGQAYKRIQDKLEQL